MVQDGFQDVSGWQSTFSLLSVGILSGGSGWFQDVSVVLVSVVSVVSCFSLFHVSAVQDKSFNNGSG